MHCTFVAVFLCRFWAERSEIKHFRGGLLKETYVSKIELSPVKVIEI